MLSAIAPYVFAQKTYRQIGKGAAPIMNALELIESARAQKNRAPYVSLDVCHAHECPAWRIGKKHAPCNCGGEQMLALLKGILRSTKVDEKFLGIVPGTRKSGFGGLS